MTVASLPGAARLTARTPVVIAARRTPIGTAGKAFAHVDVVGLTAPVIRAVLDDVRALGLDAPVDDVLLGNTRGPGGNIARVAALAAGLPVSVPGATIDRQCGSGQAAVHSAAAEIACGQADLVLAGGAESASTQPVTSIGGIAYGRAPFAPNGFPDPEMGLAAQWLGDERQIDRARQDAYSARSHRLALAAAASGIEAAELVPLAGLDRDERPRPLKEAVLQRFPGAFAPGCSVTAGNSSGISDGAAMLALVPESVRAELGIAGLAVRAWRQVGVDPRLPGWGPVPAVSGLLADTAVTWGDLGSLEITEAFAAQVLACTDAWGLDPFGDDSDLVCPQGGAIARGHPWGASGALLLVRLFSQLVRAEPGRPLGIATCAVGGGQGLALLAERVG